MKQYYFASPTAEATKVGATGRLFKKQVLPLGDWVDPLFPEDRMTFTREFLQRMVDNFKQGVAGRIAVPSFHTDDSQFNKGEVVDVALEEDGLYAYLDVRDDETAEGIDRGTTWDVSAKFTDDYQDTKTGTWFGPTLLHVALVNNPYIKKMNPFTALAESLHNSLGATVRALSETGNVRRETMTVTNTRDFPVEVTLTEDGEEKKVTLQPGETVEVAEEASEAVVAQIEEAQAPKAEGAGGGDEDGDDTDDEATDRQVEAGKKSNGEDLAGESDIPPAGEGTQQLSDDATARELAEAKRELARRDIDAEYSRLLSEGKLVPAMEQPFKELSEALVGRSRELSDGKTEQLSEVVTRLFSAMPKIVSLDDERGNTGDDTQNKSPWQQLTDEQREKLQASNISEESFNANGGKRGFSVAELTKQES